MDTIIEARSAHPYRTEIPNIIFHLGLGAHELALYFTLKRTAGGGDGGRCTKSTRTLAAESGMSQGMVSKIKARLAMPFPMLDGKPLIFIEKHTEGDEITVADIWEENIEFFMEMKKAKRSPHERKRSPHERDRSHGEPKKEHEERTGKKSPFYSPTSGGISIETILSTLNIPKRNLSYRERRALEMAAPRIGETTPEEWQALRAHHASARDSAAGRGRHRTLTSILTNWNGAIERASQYAKA